MPKKSIQGYNLVKCGSEIWNMNEIATHIKKKKKSCRIRLIYTAWQIYQMLALSAEGRNKFVCWIYQWKRGLIPLKFQFDIALFICCPKRWCRISVWCWVVIFHPEVIADNQHLTQFNAISMNGIIQNFNTLAESIRKPIN